MSLRPLKMHQLRSDNETFWPWSQRKRVVRYACGTRETSRTIGVGLGYGVTCKHCLKKMAKYKMDLFEQ